MVTLMAAELSISLTPSLSLSISLSQLIGKWINAPWAHSIDWPLIEIKLYQPTNTAPAQD